jgi:phosphate-selective porin OprO/OprP
VRAIFPALLVLVCAAPAGAQHPSIQVGEWLRVDFTARFQGDARRSDAPIRDEDSGGLDVARRRIGVEGRLGRRLDYEVEYEIGAREWRDLYVDYKPAKAVQVRGGAFKIPFGLEEGTRATALDFVYRSLISSRLAPGRDRGIGVHGKVAGDRLSYQAGVFRHDGRNAQPSAASVRVFGGRTFAARIFAQPFRKSKASLRDLHVGAALTASEVPLGFPAVRARTIFDGSFFDSDVWVQGRRRRSGVELRWKPGRFSIQSEYIRLTDERRGQSVEDGDLSPLVAHGWYASGTYKVLRKRTYGAVDLAARYETLGFGSAGSGEPSTSARADAILGNSYRATTVGVNWTVNRWLKLQANLIREGLEHPSMGPLPDRAAFWSRVVRFQFTL